MKIDPAKSEGRVTDDSYRELPEGHRTTLVVGMADMLECLAKYLDPKTLAAFEPIFQYERSLGSGDLREAFDSYMADEPPCPTCAIASSFFSMLIDKSGASQKLSN
jgi:hypothetical protein